MSAPLYNKDILRLATAIPHQQRLADAQASIEKRSPVCGSRIVVDVRVGPDGRVAAIGQEVHACALGQASSALLGQHAIGQSADELAEARDAVAAWLAGSGAVPDWPGIDILTPALPHTARHPSIRLAFEAAAEAAALAGQTRADAA